MWLCSPDFMLSPKKMRPRCTSVCGCGGQSVVEDDGCCSCLRSAPLTATRRHFYSKEMGAGVTAAQNKAARHVGTATCRRRLGSRNIFSSINLPVDRLPFPPCFPPCSRAFNTVSLFKRKKCSLLPFLCFRPFFGLICIFCLVFVPHPPQLLPFSACLLPNEALRIKCLKDCRHFRRFGRHATVHSSLRCSSDDCQTCEEHFEASVCEG